MPMKLPINPLSFNVVTFFFAEEENPKSREGIDSTFLTNFLGKLVEQAMISNTEELEKHHHIIVPQQKIPQ